MLTVLVAAFLAVSAMSAFAAPSDPLMGLADLEAKLAASPTGTLQGYLKTVWRGSAIETVPVEVQAVTLNQQTGPKSVSTLILFEAGGPRIDKYGGIVSGMSGSPIYVNDDGADKIIGALSYGDMFTIGGTGLATPIEAMAQLETDYAEPLLAPLSRPVMTDRGLVTRVLVSPDATGVDATSMKGTFVAKPLATVFLGGVSQNSPAYKYFSERMKSRGYDVVPIGAPTTSKASFSTTFDPGSSMAALAAKGDLYFGALGTTTYSNSDTVVGFGHPLFWGGETDLYLANAWIDGVWPSDYFPYKLGAPTAIRGKVTQDRGAGILGTTNGLPAETLVTASSKNVETGEEATSHVEVSRRAMGSTRMDFVDLPAYSAYVASSRVLDVYLPEGSGQATATIVVTDGTNTYTIKRANFFDSSRDIGAAVTGDVNYIIGQLRAVNNNGTGHADVLSVDLESVVSQKHRKAQIVDVQAPYGLHVGDNLVRVSLLKTGVDATQSVDVTLNIPAGTPLTGQLIATCGDPYGYGAAGFDEGGYVDFSTLDRRTLGDAVAQIPEDPTNDQLMVNYAAAGTVLDEYGQPTLTTVASATRQVGAYLTGKKTKYPSSIDAEVSAKTIPYGGSVFVGGFVDGAEAGKVKIYRRYSDETSEVLVATAPIVSIQDDSVFQTVVTGSKKNFTLRVSYEGDDETLASEAVVSIKVQARVTLKASPARGRFGSYTTLSAAVLPGTATGSVGFEKLVGRGWVRIATKAVVSGAASYKFKPAKGTTTYRARYLGGSTNVAATSGNTKVVMR